jgi:hypothetical protein
MAKSKLDEYWDRVCETDQAWIDYCKTPTETTWNNWVEAKDAERVAYSIIPKDVLNISGD